MTRVIASGSQTRFETGHRIEIGGSSIIGPAGKSTPLPNRPASLPRRAERELQPWTPSIHTTSARPVRHIARPTGRPQINVGRLPIQDRPTTTPYRPIERARIHHLLPAKLLPTRGQPATPADRTGDVLFCHLPIRRDRPSPVFFSSLPSRARTLLSTREASLHRRRQSSSRLVLPS